MAQKSVGDVTHYYDKLGVAIVKLSSPLKVGDNIHIEGHSTNFDQSVSQMQFDHTDIQEAKKGQEIGLKVSDKVREGDQVSLS